jgi:hypothetical protein
MKMGQSSVIVRHGAWAGETACHPESSASMDRILSRNCRSRAGVQYGAWRRPVYWWGRRFRLPPRIKCLDGSDTLTELQEPRGRAIRRVEAPDHPAKTAGSPPTMRTVSMLTRTTWPTSRSMYWWGRRFRLPARPTGQIRGKTGRGKTGRGKTGQADRFLQFRLTRFPLTRFPWFRPDRFWPSPFNSDAFSPLGDHSSRLPISSAHNGGSASAAAPAALQTPPHIAGRAR